ncbi:hypothetical protein PRIC1_010135 [Phytophthora ramorum]
MESEPMPSSLAMVTTPKRKLLATTHTIDAEALLSLPAPPGTQLVATQTDLEQLLRLAPSHVDDAIARLEDEERHERGSNSDGSGISTAPPERTAMAERISRIISKAIRTLRRNAHGETGGSGATMMLTASEVGEARYRRLKTGFTQLKKHMEELDEHRKQLQWGLDRLHTDTKTLTQTWPSLVNSSVTSTTNLAASLSEGCAVIEGLKDDLEQVMAKQISRKLAQLQLFEKKLEVREQLRHQVNVAEKRLQALRAGLSNRTRGYQAKSKAGDTMREIAVKRQEFQRLCRRLAVMTEALEHVFRFYFRVDQIIVEPEMEAVRTQLRGFFKKNQHIFGAM